MTDAPTIEPVRNYPPGFIGIPSMEVGFNQAKNCFMQLRPPANSTCCDLEQTWPVPVKRNELVARCLAETKNQWLCFLDSDMTFPPDVVQQLLATGKDVVSGLYFKRLPPHQPMCGPGRDGTTLRYLVEIDTAKPLVEVGWCGAGCLLIRRHVLQWMPPPWFNYHTDTWAANTLGEDVEFCELAARHGHQPWVLTSLQLGHLTVMEVTIDTARQHGQLRTYL